MLSTPERVKLFATSRGRALPEGLLMARENPSSAAPSLRTWWCAPSTSRPRRRSSTRTWCPAAPPEASSASGRGQGKGYDRSTPRSSCATPPPGPGESCRSRVPVARTVSFWWLVTPTNPSRSTPPTPSKDLHLRHAWKSSIRVSHIVSHLAFHGGQLLYFSLARNGRLPPGAAGNTLVLQEDLLSVYELPRYNRFWFPLSDIVDHHGSVFFVGVGHLRRPRDDVRTCCVYELDDVTRGWKPHTELDLEWLEEYCDDVEVQVLGLGSYVRISVFCTLGIHNGFLSTCGSTWDSYGE